MEIDLQKLFGAFKNFKVGVIGDVMLDSYLWGTVERVSPEAPVPIVSLSNRELRIGGAGNVALNLRTLGAKPFLVSVIGKDDDGNTLKKILTEEGINASYTISSSDRITTNKIRVISRSQHMLRLDTEITSDLLQKDEADLINAFENFVEKEKPQIVILQDYNKGVLTEAVIRVVIDLCREKKIITAVDPKRKNFLQYKGVDIFKPNLKEVKDALNIIASHTDLPMLRDMHAQLHHLLHQQFFFDYTV